MLLLYNFLSAIAVLLYIPRLFTKKGPEDRKVFISERLGMSDYAETDIWVHAVSVGEVLASQPFIKRLKKEFPSKRIVLTTTTYTGQKIARERFPEAERVMYMPVDTNLCIKRVVNSLRPELFISAETELWPALFHELRQAGSCIVILNGRISNASYNGYRRISFIMRKVLANVDFLYMQTKEDEKKIIEIGADSGKVGVMGNFKFDIEIDDNSITDWQKSIDGKILLAASTHKGEEEIVLDAYEAIRQSADKNFPASDLKLIIAPRHPERFDEVAGLIEKRGLDYIRRSDMEQPLSASTQPINTANDARRPASDVSTDVILLDSMGELSRLFSSAAIAFIGGSLVPTGGHNILEPAYYSKPIIFGPHMDNFPVARDFLASHAALEVKNSNDIANAVIELLNDNDKALNMGRNAKSIIEENTGSVKKAVDLVRNYIGTA